MASAVVVESLSRITPAASQRGRKRQVLDAIRAAADKLSNTPAICRKSYVHDTIVTAFEDGILERFAATMKGPAHPEQARAASGAGRHRGCGVTAPRFFRSARFRRRLARIGTGIPACGGNGEPAKIMRPARCVVRATRTAFGSPLWVMRSKRAAVAVDQVDLDQARSRRHLVVAVPAETVGQAMHRHDLAERAAGDVCRCADAFERDRARRDGLGRRLGSHPAQDFLRIGQKGENGGRRGRDLGLASDHECIGHRLISLSSAQDMAAPGFVARPVVEG